MNRKQFLYTSSFAAAAVAAPAQLLAQLLQQPAWKISMLTDQLGVFTERGGTILFCFTDEGIVVVDTQFPEQSGHLIAELTQRSSKPFRLLVNTHHHGDHSAGNIAFKELVTRVVAHENARRNQEKTAIANKTEDRQLYPNETFTNELRISCGNETVQLLYFGDAHTNGDALVHFEQAGVVHMGDLMFNRRHPYVDRSAGANISNWILVLQRAQQHFDRSTRFVFGHAAAGFEVVGKHADLKQFQTYLEQILDFTSKQIRAGVSREAFLQTATLPFSTEWQGEGLQRPLAAAFDELTRKG